MSLDVRAAAAIVIGDVLGGRSLDQALSGPLDKVSTRDRSLLQQLCYGTLREGPRLLALLERLLDRPLRDKDRDIRGLLLCGLYQLDNMRVPDHAAVATTVEATRALKKPWAKNVTNAVLRRYQRERNQLSQTLSAAAAAQHSSWMYEKICHQWPVAAASILAANNQQPPMTLRVNSRKTSRQDYSAELAEQGLVARAGDLSPYALKLATPMDVWELPGFTTGVVSVQDEAAQLAAVLLAAAPGERVLDACAAPGGKACHILELQPQLAELVAMDVSAPRLNKVSENLQRSGLQATILEGDAARPPAELAPASFDRILLDAPCSASGVIRRHPDVKLLRRESDIPALAEVQEHLLQGAWPLLKTGGTLLYVTCSLFEEENSGVILRFLEQNDDAQMSPVDGTWGDIVPGGRQLLPSPGGPDGLFYSLLKKTG